MENRIGTRTPAARFLWRLCGLVLFMAVLPFSFKSAFASHGIISGRPVLKNQQILSPYWSPTVRQWSVQIQKVSQSVELDPDFVAAVIAAESDGIPNSVSRLGAVGLMGVMPSGPGMEWRPTPDQLTDPGMNLRWGVAILTDIIRQSGGDLSAALAAYAGGWREASKRVPTDYAASVIDEYSRAVLMRNGLSPDIATGWTLAIEMNRGHVPSAAFWVLGAQPVSGIHTYASHVVYRYIDDNGRGLRVKVHVIPIALQVAKPPPATYGASDALDPHLEARLGRLNVKDLKAISRSPRVLLACLPSLQRLRGKQSTRWFAPSSCPTWNR